MSWFPPSSSFLTGMNLCGCVATPGALSIPKSPFWRSRANVVLCLCPVLRNLPVRTELQGDNRKDRSLLEAFSLMLSGRKKNTNGKGDCVHSTREVVRRDCGLRLWELQCEWARAWLILQVYQNRLCPPEIWFSVLGFLSLRVWKKLTKKCVSWKNQAYISKFFLHPNKLTFILKMKLFMWEAERQRKRQRALPSADSVLSCT